MTNPDLFDKGKALQPTPQNFRRVVVHFDGGTPCNIPRLGYGEGYGSYNFDRGQVIRVRHGIKCSANTAEILTLCCALEALYHEQLTDVSISRLEVLFGQCEPRPELLPPHLHVHVEGDSRVALKWLSICAGLPHRGKAKLSKGSSPEFRASIARLKLAVEPFAQVTCQWRGRAHAVAAFGH